MSVEPCDGCGVEGPREALKRAWVSTPLGNAVVRAHPGCEWAAIHAMEDATGGGPVKVIPEPLNDADRARRAEETRT
jgi:hypothetical protein